LRPPRLRPEAAGDQGREGEAREGWGGDIRPAGEGVQVPSGHRRPRPGEEDGEHDEVPGERTRDTGHAHGEAAESQQRRRRYTDDARSGEGAGGRPGRRGEGDEGERP
ncbi:hypothetical protein THAOC_33740, partial [Thalassiosira oceanica]